MVTRTILARLNSRRFIEKRGLLSALLSRGHNVALPIRGRVDGSDSAWGFLDWMGEGEAVGSGVL